LRFKQPNGLPLYLCTRYFGKVTFVWDQVDIELARQSVNPPKASVVAGVFVFGARVAQANKQLDHV
jgi:hypothetical protein